MRLQFLNLDPILIEPIQHGEDHIVLNLSWVGHPQLVRTIGEQDSIALPAGFDILSTPLPDPSLPVSLPAAKVAGVCCSCHLKTGMRGIVVNM